MTDDAVHFDTCPMCSSRLKTMKRGDHWYCPDCDLEFQQRDTRSVLERLCGDELANELSTLPPKPSGRPVGRATEVAFHEFSPATLFNLMHLKLRHMQELAFVPPTPTPQPAAPVEPAAPVVETRAPLPAGQLYYGESYGDGYF